MISKPHIYTTFPRWYYLKFWKLHQDFLLLVTCMNKWKHCELSTLSPSFEKRKDSSSCLSLVLFTKENYMKRTMMGEGDMVEIFRCFQKHIWDDTDSCLDEKGLLWGQTLIFINANPNFMFQSILNIIRWIKSSLK